MKSIIQKAVIWYLLRVYALKHFRWDDDQLNPKRWHWSTTDTYTDPLHWGQAEQCVTTMCRKSINVSSLTLPEMSNFKWTPQKKKKNTILKDYNMDCVHVLLHYYSMFSNVRLKDKLQSKRKCFLISFDILFKKKAWAWDSGIK